MGISFLETLRTGDGGTDVKTDISEGQIMRMCAVVSPAPPRTPHPLARAACAHYPVPAAAALFLSLHRTLNQAPRPSQKWARPHMSRRWADEVLDGQHCLGLDPRATVPHTKLRDMSLKSVRA